MALVRVTLLVLVLLLALQCKPGWTLNKESTAFSFASSVVEAPELHFVARRLKAVPVPPPPTINCTKSCEHRCEDAGRLNRCTQFCLICCSKCQCVPSGHYGNKDECPCYRDMKNSKGTSKCP